MEIVMLAAGTSSRMGKTNKMLLPWNNTTMACHCCLTALSFLETLDEPSHLIIVTGYKSPSLEKALKPCTDFIERTKSPIKMTVVRNRDYLKGQFSSAKTGLKQIHDEKNCMVCLADMPLLEKRHYIELNNTDSTGYDAVRPLYNGIPGHPVIISSKTREKILKAPDSSSVKEVISTCRVLFIDSDQKAYITDCDTLNEFSDLIR